VETKEKSLIKHKLKYQTVCSCRPMALKSRYCAKIQVNLDIRFFDQSGFRLIRSQTLIPFLYMCPLKFRIVRPIMEQKIINNAKKSRPKTVARKQCCRIVLLPRYYAAISSVSLRPLSKADVSKQCLPITAFHPK
jgi:hypothetical protein